MYSLLYLFNLYLKQFNPFPKFPLKVSGLR